jgi:hypothetical protein
MEMDKLKILLLLDLCAFAATISDPPLNREAKEEYELAYFLAKKQSLPDHETYENLLERF